MSAFVWALVVGLLLACGPSDVARSVWAIIINSINGEIRVRSIADIGKKSDEIIPAWINGDTARAIICVCFVIWIAASLVHTAPDSIKRMAFPLLAGVTVPMVCVRAPTRADIATLKVGYSGDVCVPTVALAQPVDLALGLFVVRSYRDQLSKSLIGNIQFSAASAGLDVAVFERSGNRDMSIAAIALTKPSPALGSFPADFIDLLDCNQSAETHACDIECFGHWTAPIGSRSSGEVSASNTGLVAHSNGMKE